MHKESSLLFLSGSNVSFYRSRSFFNVADMRSINTCKMLYDQSVVKYYCAALLKMARFLTHSLTRTQNYIKKIFTFQYFG